MTNEELLDIVRSLKAHHYMYHPMCQRRDSIDKFAARAFGENAPSSVTDVLAALPHCPNCVTPTEKAGEVADHHPSDCHIVGCSGCGGG